MARENQGLHIALIIFVLLTVTLGVTTFYFFKQFDEAQIKTRTADAERLKSSQEQTRIAFEASELKKMIGVAETEKLDAISQNTNQLMEKYAKTYPEQAKPYMKVVEYLAGQVAAKDKLLADAKQAAQDFDTKYKGREDGKQPQIVTAETNAKKASDDMLAMTEKYKGDIAASNKSKDELAAQLQQARKESDDAVAKAQSQLQNSLRKLQEKTSNYVVVKKKLDAVGRDTFETPHGEVRWVNQANGIVWINLGQADGLGRQMAFSVYGSDSTDMKKAVKKGSIEVTQILGEHLAEARVTEEKTNEPLLPGDKIHTPVWSPGDKKHFAIAGFIDIDGDGRSDRQLVHNLVTMSGGVIDVELDEKGERSGTPGDITPNTTYFIVGDAPTDSKGDSKVMKEWSALQKKAAEMGVEQVKAKEFVARAGVKPQTRVIHFGMGANEGDFRAKPPEGVPRASGGNVTELFKSRAPQSGTRKSTY